MNKKNNKNSAFSLIEVSIVILIIGILIAGISQSSRLIKLSRLSNARTLTQSSPINSIKNLSIWYETSLAESFGGNDLEDGDSVATWYDSDVRISNKINATQSTSGNQPKFYSAAINDSIPVLRFDGTNDYLSFDGSDLIGTNYTIFIVDQRRTANTGHSPLIGGNTTTDYQNLHMSYSSNTNLRFAHYGTGTNLEITTEGYTVPRPKIHTFMFSQSEGKKYWLNGGASPDASSSDSGQEVALTGFGGSSIGRYQTSYFNGDIAEIIIFTNDLNDYDRNDVENYLGKKYNIKIE